MEDKKQKLQSVLDKSVDHKKVFGTSFGVRHKDWLWTGASGNLTAGSSYFIASTTKLFVTAVVLHFRSKGLLNLDDTIEKYLDRDTLSGLHTLKGMDYTGVITIKNLLAHTSGIPDYFQQKGKGGRSLEDELMQGNDCLWTPGEAIERSKSLKPLFVPGEKGKAHYADTNFQLLGKIIEKIQGKSIDTIFKDVIYEPLELSSTYLYWDITDTTPNSLYYKDKELPIPKAMSSFGADGGIVSTSEEMLVFLEAFFNGVFFPKDYIEGLKT